MLLHPYQALTREIATPTLPSFVTACLQLIKAPAPGRPLKVPMTVVETVVAALSTLIPLYPTTLRPFVAQIRTAMKSYVAPTISDATVFPCCLCDSARRLTVLLHYTTPKNGNAEEWAITVDGAIKGCHVTIDQIFRAVQESWESSSGYIRQQVSYDGEPNGAGSSTDDLPGWHGLFAGSERLVGLLGLLAECFRCPTKTPITIPLGGLLDLIARITSVVPPSPTSGDQHESVQTNPSIGREEKEELWSVLPDIHVAIMHLLAAVVRRLRQHIRPVAAEVLDQVVRIFGPSQHLPMLREAAYGLVKDILQLVGSTLPKISVDSLDQVIQACCQDLLGASGFMQEDKPKETAMKDGAKTKGVSTNTNADLFLKNNAGDASSAVALSKTHQLAAEHLLACLLESLPQQQVKKAHRALMDRAAILSRSKEAMLASALHPYVDKSGRLFANVLPFLTRQYPDDADVEVLRSNLRVMPRYFGDVDMKGNEGGGQDPDEPQEAQTAAELTFQNGWTNSWANKAAEPLDGPVKSGFGFGADADSMAIDEPVTTTREVEAKTVVNNGVADVSVALILKRKSEEVESASSKRIDTGRISTAPLEQKEAIAEETAQEADDSDSNSEGSVHLDMTLDDEDDEDEDEE